MTARRTSRSGPRVGAPLAAAVLAAIGDGADTHAKLCNALDYHPTNIRAAVGALAADGHIVVRGGTRPARLTIT
ncbi:hypothetical protein [Gemmatimonas sp.]|uniref:hypothetical protein n=1 Tax=Gemmatimonas sp. TaxID=1962908 RepID=UPI003563DE7C